MDALTGLLVGLRVNGGENIKVHSFPRADVDTVTYRVVSGIGNLVLGSIRLYAHYADINNYTYYVFDGELPQPITIASPSFTWDLNNAASSSNLSAKLYVNASEIISATQLSSASPIRIIKPFSHVVEII